MIYFKFPFNEKLFTIQKNGTEKVVEFYPFNGNQKISFKGKIENPKDYENDEFLTSILENSGHLIEESKKDYFENLGNIIKIIEAEHLPKIVYSRRKFVRFNTIDIEKSFINLCKTYPNAFRYVFQQDGISWIGAFSEVLGKYNKGNGNFETMSLAGTLPVSENWTSKEIEEQKPVTNFIANILQNYTSEVEISETYDHISGNIKHLRTDFKANIQEDQVENIIKELHPTPAVCGIPKEFCQEVIAKYEKYPRELYAGYIRIETDIEILYFVNLRCARIFKNSVHIFVGGGITAQSDVAKEWRETELKSEAILKNLVIS